MTEPIVDTRRAYRPEQLRKMARVLELRDEGLSHVEIATRLGIDRDSVDRYVAAATGIRSRTNRGPLARNLAKALIEGLVRGLGVHAGQRTRRRT